MITKKDKEKIFGKAIPQLIHDIRNPLNIVIGFSSILQIDETINDEIRSYIQNILYSSFKIEELLSKYPNLYCDISAGSGHNALKRDLEFTKGFLERWQDRILYARDYFDNVHRELLESIGISEQIKEKIYENNARRVLRGGERIGR